MLASNARDSFPSPFVEISDWLTGLGKDMKISEDEIVAHEFIFILAG
jgi:hypothetical protein